MTGHAVIGTTSPNTAVPLARAEAAATNLASGILHQAGNFSAAFSIAGAAAFYLHAPRPLVATLMGAGMIAGGVDTAVELERWASGEPGAGLGATLYAATGMLPCASFGALTALRHLPTPRDDIKLAILAANVGLVGFEVGYNSVPDIIHGNGTPTSWLNFLSSLTGFAG